MEWRIILPVLCLIGILNLPGYVVSQQAVTPSATSTTTTTATTTTTTTATTTATPTTSTTTTTPTTSTAVTTTTTVPTSTTTATTHSSGATTASTASGATTASTASGATTASTASGATTASTASGATTASTASGATTASTASGATTASTASGATTASTASGATTASTASGATTASTVAGSSSTGGSTAATTTAPLPPFTGLVNLNFKINDAFQPAYVDLNNATTISFVNDLKNRLNPIYKKSNSNYYGLIVNQLSSGSIITNTSLQYDTTTSPVPNAAAVRDTLIQAISNGTLGLSIDNTSITAVVLSNNASSTTASPIATTQTTTAATTPLALTNYTFNFKIPGNFISDLSNINSAPSTLLKMFVNYQLSGFLSNFRGYQAVDVWRFRNGSINIDAWVTFAKNLSPPNITEVAKQLAAAVRNNTFLLPIDPTSINVTDILTGTTANKSPVMVSMLTALWMTLASLLFSAVIH